MKYEQGEKISEILKGIERDEYILPAFQREYVWKTKDIELLFDSILRGYPIGTFLSWRITDNESVRSHNFFKFLKYYHEQNNSLSKHFTFDGNKDRYAIIDGQQRLTSLYIGLKGHYSKLGKGGDVVKHLYINLLKDVDNSVIEDTYDLRFMVGIPANKGGVAKHWFKVGNILDMEDSSAVLNYVAENVEPENFKVANRVLSRLHKYVFTEDVITTCVERGEDYDKVIEIFHRINKGGVAISKYDLLLSIISSNWSDGDVKGAVSNFRRDVSTLGLPIKKDHVSIIMSLYGRDVYDARGAVKDYTASVVHQLEKDWGSITNYFKLAIQLVKSLGVPPQELKKSYIILLGYWLKLNGFGEEVIGSIRHSENRENIKMWYVSMLMKGRNESTESYMGLIVKCLQEYGATGNFPLENIKDALEGTIYSIRMNTEDIDNLLIYTKTRQMTFSKTILRLVQNVNPNLNYDADHIFPASWFKKDSTLLDELPPSEREFCQSHYNGIGNLQLLQSNLNRQRRDADFNTWLENYVASSEGMDSGRYKVWSFIPDGEEVTLANFRNFYNRRVELLRAELIKLFVLR